MTVLCIVIGIIGLIALAAGIKSFAEYFIIKYDYNVCQAAVIAALILSAVLFFVFWIGQDELISADNRIVALIIGSIIWLGVLLYNIKKTAVFQGFVLTVFQSLIAVFIVGIIIIALTSFSSKKAENKPSKKH